MWKNSLVMIFRLMGPSSRSLLLVSNLKYFNIILWNYWVYKKEAWYLFSGWSHQVQSHCYEKRKTVSCHLLVLKSKTYDSLCAMCMKDTLRVPCLILFVILKSQCISLHLFFFFQLYNVWSYFIYFYRNLKPAFESQRAKKKRKNEPVFHGDMTTAKKVTIQFLCNSYVIIHG